MSSAWSIEVLEFVPLESIDPIYFERSYLKPQRSAVKPYLLLRQRERRPLRPPELDLAGSLIDAKVAGREVTTPRRKPPARRRPI